MLLSAIRLLPSANVRRRRFRAGCDVILVVIKVSYVLIPHDRRQPECRIVSFVFWSS